MNILKLNILFGFNEIAAQIFNLPQNGLHDFVAKRYLNRKGTVLFHHEAVLTVLIMLTNLKLKFAIDFRLYA